MPKPGGTHLSCQHLGDTETVQEHCDRMPDRRTGVRGKLILAYHFQTYGSLWQEGSACGGGIVRKWHIHLVTNRQQRKQAEARGRYSLQRSIPSDMLPPGRPQSLKASTTCKTNHRLETFHIKAWHPSSVPSPFGSAIHLRCTNHPYKVPDYGLSTILEIPQVLESYLWK